MILYGVTILLVSLVYQTLFYLMAINLLKIYLNKKKKRKKPVVSIRKYIINRKSNSLVTSLFLSSFKDPIVDI